MPLMASTSTPVTERPVLVFAAILDFGRVAAGFHYPTDVLGGAAIGALAALLVWAPPLRRRIDALSDFIGGLWDRMLDAVFGRVRPHGVAHPRSR
jgi:membrane-associated phospholipid phosphatase